MVKKGVFIFTLLLLVVVSLIGFALAFSVSLISPTNNAFVNATIPLINATTDYPTNCTYSITNSTGTLISGELPTNATTYHNLSSLSISTLADLNYTVVVSCVNFTDSTNRVNASTNITKDSVIPNIDFGAGTDASGSLARKSNITINLTFSDTNFMTITMRVFNSSGYMGDASSSTFPNGSYTWVSPSTGSYSDGIYFFNGTAVDQAGNFNKTATRNVTLDTTVPEVTVISAPAAYINLTSASFNITSVDATTNTSACLITVDGGVTNLTMTRIGNNFNYTKTSLTYGSYTAKFYCNDSVGNTNNGVTTSFVVDNLIPLVTSVSSSASSTSATVSYTSNESANASINYGTTLSLGSTSSSSTYTTSGSVSLSGLSTSTLYYYNITICDQAANCAPTNGTYNFTTSAASSGTGGNGDGGTTSTDWTVTYYSTDAQFKNGYNRAFKEKERVAVKVNYLYHYVGVKAITSTGATISVQSTPQQVAMNIGDTKKFEVTNDSYYDISVMLNSIDANGTRANLTITSVNESISTAPAGGNVATTTSKNITKSESTENASSSTEKIESATVSWFGNKWFWVGVGVVVIAAGVAIYFYRKKIRKSLGYE